MRKTNQSPKQTNTLLNYFNKSQSQTINKSSPKSLNSDEIKINNNKTNNGNRASTSAQESSKDDKDMEGIKFALYDVVWAKLEGYPWWPSIVSPHPTLNTHTKRKGKTVFIHVQFFDDPVTRSWIKIRDIKEYLGKHKSDVPLLKDQKWNTAIEFADEAQKMPISERWALIAEFQPSDEEDMEEITDLSNNSLNKSNSDSINSPKDKSPENEKLKKVDHKSDLKRKSEHKESDRRDRKKFKKLKMESSGGEFDSESEDEYKPDKHEESSDEDMKDVVLSESEISVEDIESEEESKPKKPKVSLKIIEKSKPSPKSSFPMMTKGSNGHKSSHSDTPKSKTPNKSRVSLAEESFISVNDSSEQTSDKPWPHLKFEFLLPEKMKDSRGRFRLKNGEINPEYDPTTLSLSESFLNSQTPAHRQWWNFKSKYFDTVLFFKMGKFYELFHMDAVIAVNELQISFMRGDVAHAGFPEKAYKRYADVLIQKGYKIGRIEQTETPLMMEERCKQMKKTTKFDKVVARELCRVSTIGTRMCSVIDSDVTTDGNSYLLAISENVTESHIEFGICFIDVSIGRFYLSQFSDDRYGSRLRTLMAHNPPVELIINKKNISVKTKQLLQLCAPNARKELLKDFWSSTKTLKHLTEGEIFTDGLPDVLLKMLDENDSLHQTAKPEYELAVRSLGAIIQFCDECLIADEILTMKLFEEYKPCDINKPIDNNNIIIDLPNNMILDSFTLRNLEVFQNSLGGTEGTLKEVLNFCSTPSGKRLLHSWICSPLCAIEQIEARQMAVTDLSENNIRYEVEEVIKKLKKLPDLERLLNKIHSQGSAKRARSHPDSRAILFELEVYSKRKILDFISVLNGFKQMQTIIQSFESHIQSFKSSLLKNCLNFEKNGGCFPDLDGKLRFFDNAFDHQKAKQEGKVLPQSGADAEYDELVLKIEKVEQKFNDYLKEQIRYFGSKCSYFGTGKNRFQLEVPESAAKKITKDCHEYEIQSARKGFKRYYTPTIKKLLEQLLAAEEARDAVLRDVMRRIFETFDKHYDKWLSALKCMALLDVIISLSKSRSFLQQNKSDVCLPKFSNSNTPFISVLNSTNPCLIKYCENFIPNDIVIESELLLLTGPNMGGKSTLMRQLGLIVIMAQIGAYVPAKECILTPVDRIFTRIGAFDRIIEGESTFFVELSETSMVLRHATKHSLVLVDELGRGTSTFDGTAIACSVAKELSENIKCRTLFSSHYHTLVDEFKNNPSVKLVHMACMIENENESDPTEENITFLYKLKSDACPKSYGFNAAQLAGIPKSIVLNAFKKAKQFEEKNQMENIMKKILENKANDNDISAIIPYLKDININ